MWPIRRHLYLAIWLGTLICTALACNMPGVRDNSRPTETISNQGSINLGPEVSLLNQTIGPDGGQISIADPQSPLNGFEIQIPAAAYQTEIKFSLSYQEVLDHQLGSAFNPLTPLIRVDNGDVYAADLMQVTIPVEIPADHFAMGIFYDPTSGDISGMTPLAQNAASVTVGTRHFSFFMVTSIASYLLDDDFDTGFRPGVNDWQFTNYGSYVAPNGHCAGQSLTMMYYYLKQSGGALYGKYDNFGSPLGKTASFWEDDDLGYRLASMAQVVYEKNFDATYFWRNLELKASAEGSFYTFAYMFLLTGEPQMVSIYGPAGAHALVAFAKQGNELLVADPNFPGQPRKIVFDEGTKKFAPYTSGANANAKDESFLNMFYTDKWALLSAPTLAGLWSQLETGTIGDDLFPEYTLYVQEKSESGLTPKVPLESTYETEKGEIYVSIDFDEYARLSAYLFENNTWLDWSGESIEGGLGEIEILLYPGENHLGFYVQGLIKEGDANAKIEDHFSYIDFERVDVTYNEPELVNFGQMWNSGPLCGEEYETPYKWQVALSQGSDGKVTGTIRFHDCPLGGQVAYYVTGQVVPGQDYVIVKGTISGGAGDLYQSAMDPQYFLVRVGQKPVETVAPEN